LKFGWFFFLGTHLTNSLLFTLEDLIFQSGQCFYDEFFFFLGLPLEGIDLLVFRLAVSNKKPTLFFAAIVGFHFKILEIDIDLRPCIVIMIGFDEGFAPFYRLWHPCHPVAGDLVVEKEALIVERRIQDEELFVDLILECLLSLLEAIMAAVLSLRLVFDQPLRQTEGLVEYIPKMMNLELSIPDHSTLSRRCEVLVVSSKVARNIPTKNWSSLSIVPDWTKKEAALAVNILNRMVRLGTPLRPAMTPS
jgi:hypothetical protein